MNPETDYRLSYPSAMEQHDHRERRKINPFMEWIEHERPAGFVKSPLPPDRRGLLAALHDRCQVLEPQRVYLHDLAKSIARDTGRRIYFVFTTGRWHLILLSFTFPSDRDHDEPYVWYDEYETIAGKRVYASDQFIAHYEPDGSFHVDGVS